MDPSRFDALTKSLTAVTTRRRALAGLLGVGLTGLLRTQSVTAQSQGKPKKLRPSRARRTSSADAS
jgi:hypothetical protein